MTEPVDPQWSEQLRYNDKTGRVYASPHNLALILRFHDGWPSCLAYDERSDVIEWTKPPPVSEILIRGKFPCALRDDDETHVMLWLERVYFVTFPAERIHAVIVAIARERSFDPVKRWLDGLEWDRVRRVDSWLARLVGAGTDPLTGAMGAKWLISAVARVYEPGCQADHVLVLEGQQGTGKSSALRALCADSRWYSSDMPDLSNLKAAQEVLQGPWVLEIGELDAMKRAELSRVKAFITTRSDRYRAAYAKNPESRPRRVVFAGTTNEGEYLHDATGGRRFWPVRVGRIHVLAIIAERPQLWAEAVARYRAGEAWYLDAPELQQQAQAAQSERYQADPWEEDLAEHLLSVKTKAATGQPRITVAEALSALKVEVGKRGSLDAKRVAQCLVRLGWRRVQRRDGPGGGRLWAYEPVTTPTTTPPVTRGDGDVRPGDGVRGSEQLAPVVTGEQMSLGDSKASMVSAKSPPSPLSLVSNKSSNTDNGYQGKIGAPGPVYARASDTGDPGFEDDPSWEWRDP